MNPAAPKPVTDTCGPNCHRGYHVLRENETLTEARIRADERAKVVAEYAADEQTTEEAIQLFLQGHCVVSERHKLHFDETCACGTWDEATSTHYEHLLAALAEPKGRWTAAKVPDLTGTVLALREKLALTLAHLQGQMTAHGGFFDGPDMDRFMRGVDALLTDTAQAEPVYRDPDLGDDETTQRLMAGDR